MKGIFLLTKTFVTTGSESRHSGREVRHGLQVVRRRHPQPHQARGRLRVRGGLVSGHSDRRQPRGCSGLRSQNSFRGQSLAGLILAGAYLINLELL